MIHPQTLSPALSTTSLDSWEYVNPHMAEHHMLSTSEITYQGSVQMSEIDYRITSERTSKGFKLIVAPHIQLKSRATCLEVVRYEVAINVTHLTAPIFCSDQTASPILVDPTTTQQHTPILPQSKSYGFSCLSPDQPTWWFDVSKDSKDDHGKYLSTEPGKLTSTYEFDTYPVDPIQVKITVRSIMSEQGSPSTNRQVVHAMTTMYQDITVLHVCARPAGRKMFHLYNLETGESGLCCDHNHLGALPPLVAWGATFGQKNFKCESWAQIPIVVNDYDARPPARYKHAKGFVRGKYRL